jgi:hypothetical protein
MPVLVRRDKVLGSGLVQDMQRQVLRGPTDRDHTVCIDEALVKKVPHWDDCWLNRART